MGIGRGIKRFIRPKRFQPKAQLQGQRELSAPARAALQEIQLHQQNNFAMTFTGASFKSRGEEAATAIDEVLGEVGAIADGVLSTALEAGGKAGYESFKGGYNMIGGGGASSFVLETLRRLTGLPTAAEIFQAIGPKPIMQFYQSVAPFWGSIQGAGQSFVLFYKAIDDVRDSFRAYEDAPNLVNPGAPRVAFKAVGVLLDQRANDQAAEGAVKLAEASITAALTATGVAAVASVATEIAAKIAVLAVTIRRRAIEYKEMKKGNEALARPAALSPMVFRDCPLLGCYLITNSNTSDIVLSGITRGNLAMNWMDEVEESKKFLDPLIDKSREFIGDSLFELDGPNITTRATAQDERPWVEMFWIAHFGAMGRGYQVIQFGKKVFSVQEKLSQYSAYVTDSVRTLVKKDIELLINASKQNSNLPPPRQQPTTPLIGGHRAA